MMTLMRCFLLSCLALLTVAQAHAQGSFTGNYQLRMSEDASRYARLAGKSTVAGRLALHVTGRFTLEVGDTVKHGTYRVDDDHLTLSVEDGRTMGGIIREGRVSLEGLSFERSVAPTARRFPTDASTGRHDAAEASAVVPPPSPAPLATPAASIPAPAAVFVPSPTLPVVPPAARPVAPVRALRAEDVCGAWTVRKNGEEQRGLRMELRKDGTFRFTMVGATSEGNWSVTEEGTILLVWSKIDGEVVEAGTVKKTLPVSDDGTAFQVDTYRYERATGN